MTTPAPGAVPRAGMLATVRNRRGVLAAVEPFDGETGRLHLVHVEYKDGHSPADERLLWELEPQPALDEPNALPNPAADPMPPQDFDALLRAARWTALSPWLAPDGDGPLGPQPVASPFHGGVRIENYQLVPLLKALSMPRVSLLIADDVGLGKTVEAGLILTELLLRRRIRRVLILTPASLRHQWRDELHDKFALRFEVVDRKRTDRLRRQLGMDANPWRSFDRIVASYHYLRQPDVRDQFLAAAPSPNGSPHLPWDLLIVDECHNLMPAPLGEDSELCRTLRLLAPQFEHRLFLSATPHNGHTRSFTGLLEMLDPVRFTRTSELGDAMRRRVHDVMIRRLKRQVNDASAAPRFARRQRPKAVQLAADSREKALTDAFDAFRTAVRRLVAGGTKARRRAGTFAVEILGKRLLSCPTAFAESWRRTRRGLAESAATEADLAAAERALRRETGDDRETEAREATAATITGAWLRNFAGAVKTEIRGIEGALAGLGFDLDGAPTIEQTPESDVRFDALAALIERLLRDGGDFRADERLIVFTEYKTTLDYLARRLRERYPSDRILTLFGAGARDGMSEPDRETVKAAFNDPASRVRVLVATDAASEGLNLHRTARALFHYDLPWNPSRLEQRNGRLDRYGQGRDVRVHYFLGGADSDLHFLDHVVRKADEIRDDLGSVNEVFDRAAHRRLVRGEAEAPVLAELDRGLKKAEKRGAPDADAQITADARTEALAAEVDLDPDTLRETLEAAMALGAGRPQLLPDPAERGLHRLKQPDLPGWTDVVDEAVRLRTAGDSKGPVARLAFREDPFIEAVGPLRVFRPRPDALLMHLAHPLLHRALALLARRRYPGGDQVSRWTVRRGGIPEGVPPGVDALIVLSVEEFAVNKLRETFHRWVRTVLLPVRDGVLGAPLPHAPARAVQGGLSTHEPEDRERAADILEDVGTALKRWLRGHRDELTGALQKQLESAGAQAVQDEEERYRQRQGELSVLIQNQTLVRLERELDALAAERARGYLFDQEERHAAIERSVEERQQELTRRRHHLDELRKRLAEERARVLERLLPARFALADEAQVFPVAVEVRLPDRRL